MSEEHTYVDYNFKCNKKDSKDSSVILVIVFTILFIASEIVTNAFVA